MPRENRVITFSTDEALRALRQYAAVIENRPLQSSPFETLAIDASSSTVTAEIIGGADFGGSSRFVFAGERLAQALTYYCSSIGIPLPRRGLKSVEVWNGELQLSILLDESTAADRALPLAA
jgi:hypothetical protein